MTTALMVKLVLDRWHGSIQHLNKQLSTITDEDLERDIVPGKNRGIYVLGHLIAVHDDMIKLLDLGEKLFPELYEPFIKQADKVAQTIPSPKVLREMWEQQTQTMQAQFEKLTADAWFEKHTAVSATDFAQEPHRNKLNIIITRTSHLQYHMGQLVLLKQASQ